MTGAPTGISYELAKCCAREDFNLLVAADEPAIQDAAEDFCKLGAAVDAVQANLSTTEGVDALSAAARGKGSGSLGGASHGTAERKRAGNWASTRR